ncbi:MAG: DUF5663 domain-containing protein [Patescibacteria group bacterium]
MLTELSSQKVIDEFLNKMLSEAGMDNVSPEVRSQMFADLKNRLEDRFLATVVSNLDENKLTSFREITEGGDQEKVNQFISTNFPNAQELFSQAMMSFRDTYLGIVK